MTDYYRKETLYWTHIHHIYTHLYIYIHSYIGREKRARMSYRSHRSKYMKTVSNDLNVYFLICLPAKKTVFIVFFSSSPLFSKRVLLNISQLCVESPSVLCVFFLLFLSEFFLFLLLDSILFCMPFFSLYLCVYRRTGTLYVKVTNAKKSILKKVKQNNLSNSGK
jgi:hypothetical protein